MSRSRRSSSGRYAPGTVLDGNSPYRVLTQNMLVQEQLFSPEAEHTGIASALARRAIDAPEVDRPCVLACHRGSWTWGHWLLDTLPKIVLAERAHPKLFTYVVPADILEVRSRGGFVQAVTDSLYAYGIDPARMLRVRAEHVYRFSALFDVADAAAYPVHHSLRQMHPGVLAAMRDMPHPPPALPGGGIVALLRGAVTERAAGEPRAGGRHVARGWRHCHRPRGNALRRTGRRGAGRPDCGR